MLKLRRTSFVFYPMLKSLGRVSATLRAVQSKSETLETLLPQGVQSFNGEVSSGANTDPIPFLE